MDGCDAAVTNEVCQGQCGVGTGHHLITGYRLEIPLVSLVSVECAVAASMGCPGYPWISL